MRVTLKTFTTKSRPPESHTRDSPLWFSHWDRYLGMTAAMTQSVPTAIGWNAETEHTGSGTMCNCGCPMAAPLLPWLSERQSLGVSARQVRTRGRH